MDIIVASQINHLKLAQSFVKKYHLYNICLCFIYDRRIFPEDVLFRSGIDKNTFSEILFLELPIKSLFPHLYKLYKLKKIVKNVYKEKNPDKIYLFCFDRIYNIFFNEGKKIHAELNLIEEGLSDYFEFDKNIYEISFQRALQAVKVHYRIFKKSFINSNKIVWPFIFPYSSLQFIASFLSNPELHLAIMKLTGIHKEFFTTDKIFDNAYLSQPEKALNFTFKNVHQLDIFDLRINKIAPSSPKALFVSQSFGTKKENIFIWGYIMEILNVFSKKTGKQIDIKFHPREDTSIMDTISTLHLDNSLNFLVDEEFSAEELLITGHYDTLLGITSASLVYTQQKMENISVYSIGNELLVALGKSAPPTLRMHVNELNLRFDITQFRR